MKKIFCSISPEFSSVYLSVNSVNLCEIHFSTNADLSKNFLEKQKEISFRPFQIQINLNSSSENFIPIFSRFSEKNNRENLCK